MATLVIRDCGTRRRSKQTVHFALIIPLLLQRLLDVSDHLIGRQIFISVDRAVISITRPRIVTPSREPVACIPIVPSADTENDARVMASPPISIVPLRSVIP